MTGSTASWGNRYGPAGMFRGRAGIVIEVAPNQFIRYVLAATISDIEVSQDCEEVITAPNLDRMARYPRGPKRVRMTIEGYLSSEEQAERPQWATDVAGELTGRRELGAP